MTVRRHVAVAFKLLAPAIAVLSAPMGSVRADPSVPAESRMAKADPPLQRVLVDALEADARVEPGGWRLEKASSRPAPSDVSPKVGASAVEFSAVAQQSGSKGDFGLNGVYAPDGARWLGAWVYLAADANVSSVGLQVSDGEGETLIASVPVAAEDKSGWRWVEFDLSADFKPAYPQKDKNGKVDAPLRGLRVAWFAREAGPTRVVVDGLVAATPSGSDKPPSVSLVGGTVVEPGRPLDMQLVLTSNSVDAKLDVEYSVQSDPGYFSAAPPDGLYGSDHALGAKSWTVADGKTIEENSLTDGKEWTNASTDWKSKHWTETFQYVDLGRSRRITRIEWLSGDANWVAKVDVSASSDGKAYAPVASLQNVEVYKKWGRQTMPVAEPFEARFLRLRYHDDEGKKADVIRMPSALSVYDGADEESFNIPSVGPVVAQGTQTLEAPLRSFVTATLGDGKTALSPGAYLVVARVKNPYILNGRPNNTQLIYRNVLVLPEPLKDVSRASRFGLNASDPSLVAVNRRLGIGWVRFENFKWPMISPKPGEYRFDGSVGPWHVNHDAIVGDYADVGITVLPFLFLTAPYATSASADVKEGRHSSYPPKDNAAFAEFCFQSVARYGSAKHDAAALKTPDKASGKGQIPVYEIWNEPNLTAPSWGPWVGTAEQYLTMFRAAAEAVKNADPKAQVTNGGYAGLTVGTVSEMATFKYPDGKRPLDFVDVLNVHYYSGQVAPERATIDTNVERTTGGGGGTADAPTYETHLKRLAAWRDKEKPGLPIWLTETGYDTGGPKGVSEQLQAARLPRVVMTALANGIDKVFVYRESGSTPSLHAASGLLREDRSYKPSYFTFATLIRQLDGLTRCDRVAHADPNVRVYLWRKPQGDAGAVLTAWAVDESGTTPTLGLDLGKCTTADAFGARRDAELTKATPLTIFPMYVSGVDTAKLTLTKE